MSVKDFPSLDRFLENLEVDLCQRLSDSGNLTSEQGAISKFASPFTDLRYDVPSFTSMNFLEQIGIVHDLIILSIARYYGFRSLMDIPG